MPSLVTLVFALTYLGMALGRVPGLKLDRAPRMIWNRSLMSYELRDTFVSAPIA